MGALEADAALSAREGEVAALYVEGLSYKEIARLLEISPGTVRTHLNAIYRKLAVTSRTLLARRLAPPSPSAPNVEPAQAPPPSTSPCNTMRQQLSFICADIVGSTELASRLDAEDMHELLSAFRKSVRRELDRFGGHAAGFPDDGAVAVFGWPEAVEDAPQRAARAALAIAAAAGLVRAVDGSALAVRVGVATGLVVVEGSEGRADDFVGMAVNLAARLQMAAPPGGALVSALTHELVGRRFEMEPVEPLELRGFRDPVPAYRLVREVEHLTRFEAREGGRRRGSMLGRDVELQTLASLWSEATKGRGGGALLLGEAGIGKSRLAETLARSAVQAGGRLLRFQMVEGRDASPLWPVRSAISAAAGIDPDETPPERRGKLDAWLTEAWAERALARSLIAHLLDIIGDEELPAMSSSRLREQLLEALAAMLTGLARRSPLLILLEDVHWIDPSTLDLAGRLLDQAPMCPMLLVMTSRPEGANILHEHGHIRLILSRLDAAQSEQLVRERAADAALGEDVVAEIVARTDGIPLFVEETTSAVLNGAAGPQVVPATLHESLAARLDRLGEAQQTAQIAAAIGRDVDLDLLSAVSERSQVEADLVLLAEAGLADRRRGGFTFSHALVQDAAYQSMIRARRRELHARIAEAMLGRFRRRFANDHDVLALHLERAGRTAAAIDYYLRAADAAGRRAANREAEGFAQRALELAETLDGGADRHRREVAALLALGRIISTRIGYGREEAAAPLRRALELCQAAGMQRTEFPMVVALTAQASVSGDGSRSLQLAERAETLAGLTDDPVHRVMASYAMGMARCWRGERRDSSIAFQAGAEIYDEAMHKSFLAIAPHDSGIVCLARGAANSFLATADLSEFERMDRAMELATRLGHAHSLNYALHWKTTQAIDASDWDRAEAAMRATIELAEEQDFSTWKSMGRLSVARFAAARSSAAESLEKAQHALDTLPDGGNLVCLSYVKGLAGDALRRLGRRAEAMALLREAVDEAERGAAQWGLVDTLRALARGQLDVDGGAASNAQATLTRAVQLARRQSACLLELRAAADLAELLLQGDRAMARRVLKTALQSAPASKGVAERRRAESLLGETMSNG